MGVAQSKLRNPSCAIRPKSCAILVAQSGEVSESDFILLQQEHRNVHSPVSDGMIVTAGMRMASSPAISSNRNAALQWPLMAELKLMMSWMACTGGRGAPAEHR